MGAVEYQFLPSAPTVPYNTLEDTTLTKDAGSGVLFGASTEDKCETTLTAVVSQAPAHGSLSLVADGSFTYTPAPDFNGADGFEFLVSDSKGRTAVGKASITVGESLSG
jgi:hypothetical protein